MKAIVVEEFGGPQVLKLKVIPDPVAGTGQVLVKICAIGVNPVDVYIRTGTYARKPGLPYVPGSDAAGIVHSTGAGVSDFKRGDVVYVFATHTGAYAEFAVCPHTGIHKLPASVGFSQGAALGIPYATAYRGLFQKAKARPGETVLIHGASGGVGHAAVQLAKASGLSVIGTAGTEEGLDFIMQNGADHALDHTRIDHFDQILKITDGKGADVIIELLANKNLGSDLKILSSHGRVIVIGNRGTVEIDPRDLMSGDGAIMGMTLFNACDEDLKEIHEALIKGLEKKDLIPVIGREFRLEQAAKAHEAVMRSGAHGKIVLIP